MNLVDRVSLTRIVPVMLGTAILALAACSDDPVVADAQVGQAGNGVCLQTAQIDHTQILNDTAILFFMKGGKIWLNTMSIPCPSLTMEDGFGCVNDVLEVCSNSQTIRVARSGNFCELGQFTPFVAPTIPAIAPPK